VLRGQGVQSAEPEPGAIEPGSAEFAAAAGCAVSRCTRDAVPGASRPEQLRWCGCGSRMAVRARCH
jgi:hypothetical protein